ncbi:hypothetical protein E2542_SST29978 [Spatholobus suberectus]|nr:hypothetical protein E2542_SST29978 [Spatholobus suberectus]
MKENTSPLTVRRSLDGLRNTSAVGGDKRELSARPILAVIDGDPSHGGANDSVGGAVVTVRWRKKGLLLRCGEEVRAEAHWRTVQSASTRIRITVVNVYAFHCFRTLC